jgi:signal transduction histidine kinase
VGTGTTWTTHLVNGGGLNKLDRKTGKFTRYMHNDNDPHSLIDNRIRSIFEDSWGNFWIGTAGDGLHIMNRAKGTFERYLYDSSHPEKLSRPPVKNTISYGSVDHITFITEDNKRRIWIGTFGGGINVYDPSTQKVFYYGTDKNSKENLGDNQFWTAYKTRDNTLWISTYPPGDKAPDLYKVIPYQNILPHTRTGKAVHAFAEDNANGLWLGTESGLIHKETDGTEEQLLINKDSSSLSNIIIHIEKDSNKLWIGTGHGLFLFDPVVKTFTGYNHHRGNVNSLVSDTVVELKKTRDNNLWIGTLNGLDFMDIKSGIFTHFQNNLKDTTSISNNVINCINIDRKGNVWAATNQGLNQLDKQTGHFKRYLNQFPIFSITEDKEGNLWCGTNTGLFKYDKATDDFLSFTDESAIITASLPTVGITEDHEQNLWLTTAKGLIRLNKERNSATLYGKNQGVSLEFRSFIYTLPNGKTVFGDTSGYFVFNPELLQHNVLPPGVTISNFLLNNVPVQPSRRGILPVPLMQTKEIHLSHNQNTFSFEFSNIDFISAHADTRLLYMLQNYDNGWRKAGEERTVYYFNLPAGKYIFKVKALNAAGVAAEKDIAVIIAPPWWETWWFRILSVIAMVAVVYAIVQNHSRNLKKQNLKLEEIVKYRTNELQESIEHLKGTQAQLIQSEKMASLGELTAGIAHEIQNPLNFVNNFSEVNKELIDELQQEMKSGNTEEAIALSNNIKDNEQKIIHHGKRADAIVKGMLQHSRNSSSQKEPADLNALADEYLRLSYQGLRAKDKTFNATLQTDFDSSIEKINIVPQDIGRVLLNLYNNAFYAIKRPNFLKREHYQPTVFVSTKRLNDKIEIRVRDNGNGIPEKVVDKIFQPFFTTKPTGQGTGLGLSLSYDIIKAHGGEIKVASKEGEGSEFVIQLPFS